MLGGGEQAGAEEGRTWRLAARLLFVGGVLCTVGVLGFVSLIVVNSGGGRADPAAFESVAVQCGDEWIMVTAHNEVRRAPNIGLSRFLYRVQSRPRGRGDWRTLLEEWLDDPLGDLRERLLVEGGACAFFTPQTLLVRDLGGRWRDCSVAVRAGAMGGGAVAGNKGDGVVSIASVQMMANGDCEVLVRSGSGLSLRLTSRDFGVTWTLTGK